MYIKQYDYSSSVYGFKTFAYFAILDNINEMTNLGIGSIFLYTENEVLSIRPPEYSSLGYYYAGDRNWYDILLAGGGIRVPLGSRAGFSLIALWGLTPSAEILYSNPEIRLSFDF
jgi:hypothetical protein